MSLAGFRLQGRVFPGIDLTTNKRVGRAVSFSERPVFPERPVFFPPPGQNKTGPRCGEISQSDDDNQRSPISS